MRTQVVEVSQAIGHLLSNPIFHPSGKKLLAKGHRVCEEDIRLLSSEGRQQVHIAVLEESEVPEEEAAMRIASESACGSMEIRISAGGRANLVATEDSCLLVDEALLKSVNQSGAVTVATLPNLSFAVAGQRVGTVKSAPFAVPTGPFNETLAMVQRDGPIMQARPVRKPTVAVLYTDPLRGERARTLFEGVMYTRLKRLGAYPSFVLSCLEDEESIAHNLEHLLRARPSVVLMASTTAPAGPADSVGRAMARVSCSIESFLAPVEPGNLLLLSYINDVPIVAAPGCFRSPKPNVIDLIMPPLLAQYRLSAAEISTLGLGGLLQ